MPPPTARSHEARKEHTLQQELAHPHSWTEAEPAGPLRRCAVARVERPKDELIRFVLGPEGQVVPDLKGKLPGRGVWVTAAHDSVAEATKKNAFARAFKAPAKADRDLAQRVDGLLAKGALSAFALANKAGEMVFGFTKIEEALRKGRVSALVHASDAAEDGCRKLDGRFRAANDGSEGPSIRLFGVDELSLASGRPNVIHAAAIQGGAAENFLAAAARLRRYREGSGAFIALDQPGTDKNE